MPDQLLWDLQETARQLGGLSVRTVRRLLERGELPTVRIGRAIRIPATAVTVWVEKNISIAHTDNDAGRDVQKEESSTCLRIPRHCCH